MWTFATGQENGHEAPPIVNDGFMFVATPGNQVIALDAKSGQLIWRYQRKLPEGVVLLHPTTRGVALHGDKVLFAADEAVLVALEREDRPRDLDDDGRGQQRRAITCRWRRWWLTAS